MPGAASGVFKNSWKQLSPHMRSLLLALSLMLLSAAAPVQTLARDQVLYKGNGPEPETLDPHRAEGVNTADILRDLFEGLTIEAPDGKVIPGAASSWDISDDGRVYTFHLRDALRWSNGDPLTADDFVYSFRRSADPATGSNYSSILAPIENAEAVVAGKLPPQGDRAVSMKLGCRHGAPPGSFASRIASQPAISSYDDI